MWWRHFFRGQDSKNFQQGWTTAVPLFLESRSICWGGSSRWRTRLPDWCFLRRGTTTSLHSSVSCTGSRLRSELIQACCPCIQVLTWSSTVVPCWWTLRVGGSQPTTSPSFSAIFIPGRPPYASVNHRQQSFSCRRRTRVEQFAAARDIRFLLVYFSQTSEDSPLPALLPLTVCVVPEQWLLSFSDTLIVRVTYLLTSS